MKGYANPTREGPDGRERHCTACDTWKPETVEYFFHRTKTRNNGETYLYWYTRCRVCHANQARERGEAFRAEGPPLLVQHAEDPSIWFPDTTANPGEPVYEVAACDALRARFGF